MLRLRYVIGLSILVLLMSSCGMTRQGFNTTTNNRSVQPGSIEYAYIERYKDLAISEMRRSGIPASITLAQGMVESDYGRSTLAIKSNNHFGIKCHNDWTGATVRHNDDKNNECFRSYSNPEDSFRDHSDFLMTGARYKSLFSLSSTDYKGWARGLKQAGYATNPQYANMLIEKIEQFNLHQYDIQSDINTYRADPVGIGKVRNRPTQREQRISQQRDRRNERSLARTNYSSTSTPPPQTGGQQLDSYGNPYPSTNPDGMVIQARRSRIMERNRIQYIIVRPGETLPSLEKEFGVLRWELTKYNDLQSGFDPYPGQLLYIQPKRNKAEVGYDTYVVQEGDTMYSISQYFGIKLQKLHEYNGIPVGDEPIVGETLWLRGKRP
ncbi:MAG: glucosaminidase domain-containing protein [Bacteroidales bacterium]|nr:glucosaminidase domain-containing protein [Bacteroidales bacterium]